MGTKNAQAAYGHGVCRVSRLSTIISYNFVSRCNTVDYGGGNKRVGISEYSAGLSFESVRFNTQSTLARTCAKPQSGNLLPLAGRAVRQDGMRYFIGFFHKLHPKVRYLSEPLKL